MLNKKFYSFLFSILDIKRIQIIQKDNFTKILIIELNEIINNIDILIKLIKTTLEMLKLKLISYKYDVMLILVIRGKNISVV